MPTAAPGESAVADVGRLYAALNTQLPGLATISRALAVGDDLEPGRGPRAAARRTSPRGRRGPADRGVIARPAGPGRPRRARRARRRRPRRRGRRARSRGRAGRARGDRRAAAHAARADGRGSPPPPPPSACSRACSAAPRSRTCSPTCSRSAPTAAARCPSWSPTSRGRRPRPPRPLAALATTAAAASRPAAHSAATLGRLRATGVRPLNIAKHRAEPKELLGSDARRGDRCAQAVRRPRVGDRQRGLAPGRNAAGAARRAGRGDGAERLGQVDAAGVPGRPAAGHRGRAVRVRDAARRGQAARARQAPREHRRRRRPGRRARRSGTTRPSARGSRSAHGSRASAASRRARRASELLERVGLEGREKSKRAELSGGEQQRAALCVAIAVQPKLLLVDEVTGQLDAATGRAILELLDTARAGGAGDRPARHPRPARGRPRHTRRDDPRRPPDRRAARHERAPLGLRRRRRPDPARPRRPAQRRHRGHGGGRDRPRRGRPQRHRQARLKPSSRSAPEPRAARNSSSLEHVRRRFRTKAETVDAVRGVTLALKAGAFHALVGPSGCGKTTLLHLIAGLDRPDHGRVTLANTTSPTRPATSSRSCARSTSRSSRRSRASSPASPPATTSRSASGRAASTAKTARAKAQDALQEVGLGELAKRSAGGLSGGERQRVALARALATDASLIVADEPTANLDEANAIKVAELLQAQRRRRHLHRLRHPRRLGHGARDDGDRDARRARRPGRRRRRGPARDRVRPFNRRSGR